jgi:CheY-like chemotaxis protein
LGLAIVSRLVNLMGGEIGVESQEGQGSQFWFTITLSKRTQLAPVASPPTVALAGTRALVVDDNANHRNILQKYLQAWGITVTVATRGTEAIMLMMQGITAGQAYDVAIIDQRMPGMDGLTLGQAVRSEPALASTRLIMLTAFDDKEWGQRALAVGFAAYLTKPVRQARLRDAIAQLLVSPASAPLLEPHSRDKPITGTVIAPDRMLTASSTTPNFDQLPAAKPTTARILLVEDQPTNQLVALKQLATLGFQADLATHGAEALQRLTQPGHSYDLVLLDCQMPEMDGFEVTRRLRQQETRQGGHIPIIAMTAQALKGDRERCLAAGMDDYLSKPVRIEALSQVVARWLHVTEA